jgi:tetratricopeptide (TPR) repeat protein
MSSVEADLMAASLLLRSNPADAARRADLLLQRVPGHAQASLLLALACLRLRDGPRAVAVLESLAAQQPDSAMTRLELGKAYLACARNADALLAFETAVELDGRLAEGWRELSVQLDAAGKTVDSDRAYARYFEFNPDSAALIDARVALAENRLSAAENLLTRRLTAAPDDVVARRMLADVATKRDNNLEAERLLYECLGLAPGFAAARFDLVRTLHVQQKHLQSLVHIERLLAAHPERLEYMELKAQALRFLGRNAEALALLQRAAESDPSNAEAWLSCGHLLREVGESDRSIEMYRRALAANPRSGSAYWSLANLKTFRFTETDVEAMRRLRDDPQLKKRDRVPLEFALGKALEDAAQYERAFEHYVRGNALHRSSIVHDAAAVSADVRLCQALHTREFFAERAGWGSQRRDPIFIVGLPRSGSTLLEQILGGHSQIEATMELTDIPNMAVELIASDASRRYPTALTTLDRHRGDTFAARYLDQTQHRRTAATPRFVDKMLGNFAFVGFIHLLFPNASIIDIRRHPMASCFACFKQFFARGSNFSYEFTELGQYYRDYVSLMGHIDDVLPGRVLRISYEDLIANPEAEVRKVLDYCGVPFEEECLRFYEQKRIVRTISSEQVRLPIYTDSLERWRAFEPWLGPLKEGLANLA